MQYLTKEVSNEFDFFHVDKHESFLQIDIMVFDRDGRALPDFPK